MLYLFLVPLAKEHIVFNVFRYVTFRSFMALITALVISLVVGPWLIRRLRRMQHGAETIREDTPERHRGKQGTPTMGGLVILAALLLSTLLWANLRNLYVWVVILTTASFGLVGASNAVNLTDGLDGLAIGPIVMAGGAFGIIAYLTGNFRAADYLKILNVRGAGELSVFCAALIGAAVGFLWFNCHPAEVFMGDAGSLALGGAIGMLAVLTKAELLLPLIGGLYVVEAGSVIIQVASFKLTGRRVFRMAPLHHHYELTGWAEPKIVVRFWIVSFALALLALTTLKLR